MERVSVGRDVHFVGEGSKRGAVCRAAKVTVTKEGDVVSLCVFNPQMVVFKQTVKFDGEAKKPGTWHFPEPAEDTAPVGQAEPDAD